MMMSGAGISEFVVEDVQGRRREAQLTPDWPKEKGKEPFLSIEMHLKRIS